MDQSETWVSLNGEREWTSVTLGTKFLRSECQQQSASNLILEYDRKIVPKRSSLNDTSADQIKSRENPTLKKSHFWKWFLGISLVLIVPTFWAIGIQFRTVPPRVSKETTFVTAPLKSDGKSVDFLAAFEQVAYSDSIATDENGYRLFVQRFGPAKNLEPEQVTELLDKLGLDGKSISADLEIVDPYDVIGDYCSGPDLDPKFVRALDAEMVGRLPSEKQFATRKYDDVQAELVLGDRIVTPWTLTNLPMMKGWIETSSETIAVLSEAVNKETFEIPFLTDVDGKRFMDIGSFESRRMASAAKLLSVDARYQLGTGNIDTAIDEMIACKRLGRLMQVPSNSTNMVAGLALEGIADAVGICGISENQPTRSQLDRLQTALQDMPSGVNLDQLFLFSRLKTLAMLQCFSRNGVDKGAKQIDATSRAGINWNIAALRVNELFDSREFLSEYFIIRESLLNRYLIGRRSRMLVDGILKGLNRQALSEYRRNQRGNNLRKITLAMLSYEKDHGTLPPAFTVDGNGKPLHSWRVLILPYLGQQELYEQLKLDEPWDSAHNKKYWTTDLSSYQCLSEQEIPPGKTNFSVVIGADAAFEGAVGKSLDSFGPNSGSLILVVERLDSVGWMDPLNEIPIAMAELGINRTGARRKPLGGIGSDDPFGAQVGLRDGSVQLMNSLGAAEKLEEMLRGTYCGKLE